MSSQSSQITAPPRLEPRTKRDQCMRKRRSRSNDLLPRHPSQVIFYATLFLYVPLPQHRTSRTKTTLWAVHVQPICQNKCTSSSELVSPDIRRRWKAGNRLVVAKWKCHFCSPSSNRLCAVDCERRVILVDLLCRAVQREGASIEKVVKLY